MQSKWIKDGNEVVLDTEHGMKRFFESGLRFALNLARAHPDDYATSEAQAKHVADLEEGLAVLLGVSGSEHPNVVKTPTHTQLVSDQAVLWQMRVNGGGFVSMLAEAGYRADASNLARIKAAFPDLWATYGELAAKASATEGAGA
jgi:hypothetical protein